MLSYHGWGAPPQVVLQEGNSRGSVRGLVIVVFTQCGGVPRLVLRKVFNKIAHRSDADVLHGWDEHGELAISGERWSGR